MASSEDNPAQRPSRDLRTAAVEVLRTLVDAGHEAYFAGGCVRDKLLGIEPADYDIATDAKPDEVGQLFRRTQHVGESFGVVLVSSHGHQIEVATFRTDGVYSDGRHPDTVTYSDAVHDAQRRDFTINGLFENPLTNEIIDHVGGQADLEARTIRAIGDADARIREDRLRMLRAVRFASRFGFDIEQSTADAIRRAASDLQGVSRERIGWELKRMLSHESRAVAARELQDLGLDSAVLDEANLTTATTRLEGLPKTAPYPTALTAWLLDRHEAADDRLKERSQRWSGKLLLSNAEQQQLTRCLGIYQTLRTDWSGLGIAKQKRLASQVEFQEALAILQTIEPQEYIDIRRHTLVLAETGLEPTPLIDGNDLTGLGLTPGPIFGRVLEAVYDAQLEGSVRDSEAALALASALAKTLEDPDGL